ncbi:peptidase S8/S53 domain-containing protein [Fimicolochytrium jonesii]|uniref:peptidase S8/S53 domain-containing protein n=1 Tax=Fimicolochytrium jonesii TaxID=1396493 RepID=UPI0022FE0317|nr:peptidase S8/S53 domain-containing protein [Fimicolochytrium jonesii]KAI8819748.1 peptidase S8/S53 domain-containing protein [Fimicolochytrium jonesii]
MSPPPAPTRRLASLLLLFLGALPAILATPSIPAQQVLGSNDPTLAPLISHPSAEAIDGKYIVVVREGMWGVHMERLATVTAQALTSATAVRITPFTIPGLTGYSITCDEATVDELRRREEVEFVERDQVVRVKAVEEAVQVDAPWGLARISHRELPKDNETSVYEYYANDGKGVTVYVVDTGINIKHEEFEGRAKWGATIPDGDEDVDGNGHGTHVAGTIASRKYGVAKKATVVGVKVLRSSGSGTMSDVVRGIEWVIKDHQKKSKIAESEDTKGRKKKIVRSLGNMSLGGGLSRALNQAVDAASTAGVLFAVAAGNDNQDACHYSPASSQKALTVGATTSFDTMAWFSNWGECTDVFAPGHLILSTWIGSSTAVNTISGTSMAAPHVAGILAAFYSRKEYEKATAEELKKAVVEKASRKLIKGLPPKTGTKNRLAFSAPPE